MASKISSSRKVSLTAGLLYVITFVSIPTLAIYGPVKSVNYILGAGPDTSAVIGGILEIIVALSGIATAIVLYPILKKQNASLALGLVAARILESGTTFVGVAFLSTIVSLRQNGAGPELVPTAHALAALYDRMFLLGQGFMPAICDILLGFMLYKSRLVPRWLSIIGIIGGPVLLLGYFAVLFGLTGQRDPLAGMSAIPVALFELSLGIWLIIKGFNSAAFSSLSSKTDK